MSLIAEKVGDFCIFPDCKRRAWSVRNAKSMYCKNHKCRFDPCLAPRCEDNGITCIGHRDFTYNFEPKEKCADMVLDVDFQRGNMPATPPMHDFYKELAEYGLVNVDGRWYRKRAAVASPEKDYKDPRDSIFHPSNLKYLEEQEKRVDLYQYLHQHKGRVFF